MVEKCLSHCLPKRGGDTAKQRKVHKIHHEIETLEIPKLGEMRQLILSLLNMNTKTTEKRQTFRSQASTRSRWLMRNSQLMCCITQNIES